MTSAPCLVCGHPLVAETPDALTAAGQDHADYVNASADRATDPHFEDIRREALITDGR